MNAGIKRKSTVDLPVSKKRKKIPNDTYGIDNNDIIKQRVIPVLNGCLTLTMVNKKNGRPEDDDGVFDFMQSIEDDDERENEEKFFAEMEAVSAILQGLLIATSVEEEDVSRGTQS